MKISYYSQDFRQIRIIYICTSLFINLETNLAYIIVSVVAIIALSFAYRPKEDINIPSTADRSMRSTTNKLKPMRSMQVVFKDILII